MPSLTPHTSQFHKVTHCQVHTPPSSPCLSNSHNLTSHTAMRSSLHNCITHCWAAQPSHTPALTLGPTTRSITVTDRSIALTAGLHCHLLHTQSPSR
eukprot:1157379-Pelagomonas_calceolata.AAC.3